MSRLLAIVVIICLIFECNAGTGRIISGWDAELGEFPMMAQIIRQQSQALICGGSIITNMFVLSAAHCFKHCDDLAQCATKFRIIVGDVSLMKRENSPKSRQVISVKTLISHERYNSEDSKHDILLIELSSPITFSKNAGSGSLARTRPRHNENCIIAGWGRVSKTEKGKPVVLQAANIQIFDEKKCEARSKRFWRKGMICAGDASGTNACFGDSGGPLICDGDVVVGVISFGYGDNRSSSYTDVSAYRRWVTAKIGNVNLRNGCERSSSKFFTFKVGFLAIVLNLVIFKT